MKYTPCAIVKFDDLPNTQQVFKYRTVPLDQLFPYALASAEEKFQIAESYGKIYEFVQEHCEMFENFDEDEPLDESGNEFETQDNEDEYFSTSSAEELFIATIHEV